MGKGLIRIGYTECVMDLADAVTLMEIMSKAEKYEANTHYNTMPSTTSYHVWNTPDGPDDNITLRLMPETLYRVAKLAGKPEDK